MDGGRNSLADGRNDKEALLRGDRARGVVANYWNNKGGRAKNLKGGH